MGKKNGKANAPELQHILLEPQLSQQPPHNPYYPDLSTNLSAPPPYPNLTYAANNSIPMSRATNNLSFNYAELPRQAPAVVVQQPCVRDFRREIRSRKVRNQNNQMLLLAIVVMGLSIYATSLYEERNCLNYSVHQPAKGVILKVLDVRAMQMFPAIISAFVVLLCLGKCCCTNTKNHSCYLFLMGMTCLAATAYCAYLSYLAFYSPCSTKVTELLANAAKSIVGDVFGSVPDPDKQMFRESNVIQMMKEDRAGFIIFIIDVFHTLVYFSGFTSVLYLC